MINRQFRIAARPRGWVKESDFDYREEPLRPLADGEVLVATEYISIDPSMRGQMENRGDYVAPLAIGDVMRANGAARVLESRHQELRPGTLVSGTFGMQDYCITDGRNVRLRTFPQGVDGPTALGVLGGTGMTAYFGMLRIGMPKPGEVVLVSAAAGATGHVAGQIAKIEDCTVVGLAGSDEKCAWLRELGFDGAIDYKHENVGEALDRLCPRGIDVYFDNVGGEILDLALARIRQNARVVLCGGISRYNAGGRLRGPENYFNLVFRRARMEGFIVLDYANEFAAATQQMKSWLDAGRLRTRNHVIEGFENLPKALIAMFEGENIGKTMVDVRTKLKR